MPAPTDEPRDPATGRLAELAERRARRAAETGLIERAERAERTVGALERRLDEAEGRLEIAQRERATLSASLEQARRDLTAALQREFAEQRMRAEQECDASGALAELESDIERLGADHDAAEARAAALAHALEVARHEVVRAKARAEADRQAVAVDEHGDGLRLELGELQVQAKELHGSLLIERAAREEAEQALDCERERAEAEVTLLQYELDRRALVHEAVSAQIEELRSALDSVRSRAERTEELEQAIVTMEGEQRRAGVRLSDTRELLSARGAALVAVEDRLVAREAELGALRDEAERLAGRLEAVESELADTQAAAVRERRRAEGLATRAEELRADAAEQSERADRAEAASAELAAHVTRDQQVEAALDALREELGQARAENSDRAEREAAVETLVGDLVETAHGLRIGYERELEGLATERDAVIADERAGFAAELAGMQRRVGELRGQLTQGAEQLREELEEERKARWVAEAELAQEVGDRVLAEERAAKALDALTQELARLRVDSAANPFYGVAPAGPLVPSADHPALVRPAATTGAPAVVGDLVRAMDRLRGATDDVAAGSPPIDDPETTDAAVFPEEAPEAEAEVDVEPSVTDEPVDDADGAEPVSLQDDTVPPPAPDRAAAVGSDWFSGRLAAFARTDEGAAERLLLSSLAAQAMTATKDVTYELELPMSGRYRVEVAHGIGVSVAPVDPGRPQEVEFRIEAPVGAVAALAGGTAPRRLTDVTVRGRRRRLRRLLRALGAPVGLTQLRSAGAQPPPADLLAMLCDGVQPDLVLGAGFTVAYDVSTPHDGSAHRVVVRAQPDGRLGLEPDTSTVPDATLALDIRELLAVLSGSSSVAVAGDDRAAETLHLWLHGVQGL